MCSSIKWESAISSSSRKSKILPEAARMPVFFAADIPELSIWRYFSCIRDAKWPHTSGVASLDPSSTTITSYRFFGVLCAARLSRVPLSIAARLNVGITTLISGGFLRWLGTNLAFPLADAPTLLELDRAWALGEVLLVFFKSDLAQTVP